VDLEFSSTLESLKRDCKNVDNRVEREVEIFKKVSNTSIKLRQKFVEYVEDKKLIGNSILNISAISRPHKSNIIVRIKGHLYKHHFRNRERNCKFN
jgi:hypothetical protein